MESPRERGSGTRFWRQMGVIWARPTTFRAAVKIEDLHRLGSKLRVRSALAVCLRAIPWRVTKRALIQETQSVSQETLRTLTRVWLLC